MANILKMKAALFVALAVLCLATGASAQTPAAPDQVFYLKAGRVDTGDVTLRWSIEPGNYLYRESLEARLDGKPLTLGLPPGETKDDPNFGRVMIFHDQVESRISGLPSSGALFVSYQGCAEQGICYPRITKSVDLATMAITGVRLGLGGEPLADGSLDHASAPASGAAEPAAGYLAGNPLLMAAAFLGFGLLLAFTPCVLPMIPILSAMLARSGERLSMARGFVLSAAYVLAMAVAYGIVGLVAGWSGANLQAMLQTPLALSLAAAVFIALALSMFGLYDIALPSALAARLSGSRSDGSVVGAALLGLGSALIVGPCVTPPLAAAMLFAVQSGEAAKGAAALFFLGLGMGLPLIVFGTFGGRILPRAGVWTVRVRQGFAVVFLGVAAMLVARLLSPPVALALWGASSLALGVFVGGFDVIQESSGWQRRVGKSAGLLASLYGATLIVGAASGSGDPARPLGLLAARDGKPYEQRQELTADSLTSFAAAVAARAGKPILVSFGADWCTVCKSNDAVMQQPGIRRRLDALPVINVDLTKQGAEARALMERFAVVGPPTMFLLDLQGREIPGSRLIGPITAEDLASRLTLAGA